MYYVSDVPVDEYATLTVFMGGEVGLDGVPAAGAGQDTRGHAALQPRVQARPRATDQRRY